MPPLKSLVLLMIEPEQPEALSARKLVIETVKHNVITAYNPEIGMNLLHRFPAVDAVFVHADCLHTHGTLLKQIKEFVPDTPLIVGVPSANQIIPEANFIVDSHMPSALVDLLAGPLHASIRN